MNDLEASLRDALSARAGAVTYDPAAYAAVTARRSRRRIWRVSSVGAAAATLAVVGVAVAVVRPSLPEPTGPAAAAPVRMVAIVDGAATFVAPDDLSRVNSSVTEGHATTAVAAVGDGRRFFAADHRHKDCTTVLLEHLVEDSWSRVSDLSGTTRIAGGVSLMAASRDGTRLAYAFRPRDRTGTCGRSEHVRVRDLRTGVEKVWTEKHESLSPFLLSSLEWAPDDRYLSLGPAVPVIDTAGPGGTFENTSFAVQTVRVAGKDCQTRHRVYRGMTGESAAFVTCYRDDSATPVGAVYELDPATGVAGKRLFKPKLPEGYELRMLTFDTSGDHAFLEIVHGDPVPYRLYRWDHGKGVRFVDTGGRRFEQVRW